MFYSHTYLSRKGPMGIVWCAAHLHHRLRKSHFVATNVPSTVEKIMNPEMPIALRMSSHLLLGVVRIYSKQVDYFFEECNEIRITINRVLTTVNVDLPNDATQAPFHSVTLPEKFDLDTMDLDDDDDMDWQEDSHLKSLDEITLTEQIPTGKDPYIMISFDEHDLRTSSVIGDTSGSGSVPMDEDDHPHVELDASAAGFKSPSPSNLKTDGNRTPQDKLSIEVMRDARRGGFDFNNSPILPDRAEPDKFLEDLINRDKDKEIRTPVREEVVLPDARFSSSHHHEEQHSPGPLDSRMPFAHHSPELELQPTPELEIQPTPPVPKPKDRRKRRHHYDTETVLSNEYIRNTLDDTSDILRVRVMCPKSSLSIWKRNNRRRLGKEGLFAEPYVTGCCADLQDIYREDCAKNHLVTIQETHQEENVGDPSSSRHGNDIEIEVLRNNDRASPEGFIPTFSTPVPSPSRRNQFTPENPNLRLETEHLEMTENVTSPKSNVGASGNLDSEIRTPDAFFDNDMQFDNTGGSDIPELVPSGGDLEFLEKDDNPPAGTQRTPEIGTPQGNQSTAEPHALSSRTRAVAQYLKKKLASPLPVNSEESSEEISLNEILKDKPRRTCARLFYETLVLKSHGLIDVRQEEPYGNIDLKVTPKMPKEQFLG